MVPAAVNPPSPTGRPTGRARLALETTLLLHGVPRAEARALDRELSRITREAGAWPCRCGVVAGRPIAGMTDAELDVLLNAPPADVPKLNSASLGLAVHRGGHGATTVSATMELAAGAGIRVFATGGLGGVHRGLTRRLDISADLLAFTRFPVAVVASGCKSILDVAGTREMLETLGVPVVGWRTDEFPAFYQRRAPDATCRVDARFEDLDDLAAFIDRELNRTQRGVVVCNPIPPEDEIPEEAWTAWLGEAERRAGEAGAQGRDLTPALLSTVHALSGGRTLRANIALVKSNVALGAALAVKLQARAEAGSTPVLATP